MSIINECLNRFPRISLTNFPTPLYDASRLAHKLGISSLFVKRDDLTGLALGGNKVRKLEFILADALSKGADAIIISAAAQSNMVRLTAAACAKLGVELYAVLRSMEEQPSLEGNLFLDHLFGAKVKFIPTLDPYSDLSVEVMNDLSALLRRKGKHPYIIDLRYHSGALAALGYLAAVEEIYLQIRDFDQLPGHIFLCTGSGTTQTGLLLGVSLLNLPIKIIGISVQKPADWIIPRVKQKLLESAALLNIDLPVDDECIIVDDRWIGQSYGIPSEKGIEAINLLAEYEGVLLDPVYSGKGMAGLIGWIREGQLKENKPVMFLHSGGVPSLFLSNFKEKYSSKKIRASF